MQTGWAVFKLSHSTLIQDITLLTVRLENEQGEEKSYFSTKEVANHYLKKSGLKGEFITLEVITYD